MFGWGKQQKPKKKTSEFFEGKNIFTTLVNSTFGKVKQTLEDIFSKEDIKNYTLPKVIVIGNESTGKSSLLENITKCQLFPRDIGICTKCPIHIKLKNGSSKYVVKYITDDGVKTIILKKKKKIYGVINKLMGKISGDTISENEITVEITDNDMPTFEFYDLPGIRTYPQSTAVVTTNLCKKYLQDKNSIVICVVPATTTRLTACQSIALITEMKMEHNCILALTMADRLQPENIEELLIKRILQTSDEIEGLEFAGYIAVVNRLHSNVHSLEENDNVEDLWFKNNILKHMPLEYLQYKEQIRNNVTITNLISNMDKLYNKFIHQDWKPRILKGIDEKINKLEITYAILGKENENVTELNKYLEKFVNKLYNHDILVITDKDDIDDSDNDDKYYKIIDSLDNYTITFDDLEIEKEINNYFENDTKYILKRFKSNKEELVSRLKSYFNELNEQYIDNITTTIRNEILHDYINNKLVNVHDYMNRYYEMYKLLILYKVLKTYKVEFGTYTEYKEYKAERMLFKQKIDKIKNHGDKIKNLV